MCGHEIADVFVESPGSNSELAGSFIKKFTTGFLIKVSVFVSKEDILDKAFDFIIAGSDPVFDPCLLDGKAVGQEALGEAVAGLKEHAHLLENRSCQNIRVLDDVFVKIVTCKDAGFARKRGAVGDFHRDLLDIDGVSLEFLL